MKKKATVNNSSSKGVEAKRENFLHVNIVVEKVILISRTEEGLVQNVANAINQRHDAVICKCKISQQELDAQIAYQDKKDQLFVAISFSSIFKTCVATAWAV
ncbi:hypothetical protein EPI10_025387 [Gossypium australe]|uniref:Uncharacterized protein n=1 Tax=Gossypium australe TaxID=47621 RepID=A0A5B6W239_9ROSI|nr:hypothetical protein EPI10_025387 [Gossypium australe]